MISYIKKKLPDAHRIIFDFHTRLAFKKIEDRVCQLFIRHPLPFDQLYISGVPCLLWSDILQLVDYQTITYMNLPICTHTFYKDVDDKLTKFVEYHREIKKRKEPYCPMSVYRNMQELNNIVKNLLLEAQTVVDHSHPFVYGYW